MEALSVVGWAARPGGEPADIGLLIDGQPAAGFRVERILRPDVLQALQVGGEPALGFRVVLPPEIWRDGGAAAAAVELLADGVAKGLGLPPTLDDLVEDQRRLADEVPENRFIELAQHVRGLGSAPALAAGTKEWLERQVRLRGGWSAVDILAQHPGVAPRGLVERLEQGVIHGWAFLDFLEEEPIGLLLDGEPLDCAVIRVERADVQRALHCDRVRLGFEIEVPPTIWRRTAGMEPVSLGVRVAGRPLGGSSCVLSRQMVLDWLDRQRQVEASVTSDETADQRRERQYATLLILEHLGAAGLVAGLDAVQRRFVFEQAQRYGVTASLGAAAVSDDAEPAQAGAIAAEDYATTVVWQLLRAFNQHIDEAPDRPVEEGLHQVLQDPRAAGRTRQSFLWAVIPYFCSLGRYAALRPHLDVPLLRQLVRAGSVWELSLLLPEVTMSGDFRLARLAMKKIASGRAGWLNTDCVLAAIETSLAEGDGLARRSNAVTAFWQAFLDLLEQLATVGYWSRLHDLNLIRGLAALLAGEGSVGESVAWRAEKLALRAFALVPDFWRVLDQANAPLGGWSARLLRARSCFEQLRHALAQAQAIPPSGSTDLVQPLAWLRSVDNLDVDTVARELALAQTARMPAPLRSGVAGTLLHRGNDLLRLAAAPAPTLPVAGSAAAAEISDEIRALADVAAVPRRAAVAALVRRCLVAAPGQAPGEGEVRAMQALAGRDSHHLGVRLAAADWMRRRRGLEPLEREAALVALREMWIVAFDDCLDLPHPPATLIATFSQLDAGRIADPDEALERVVQEMRQRLHQRYGAGIGASVSTACAEPRLEPGSHGLSTLVAVYSCRRNLPTRVRAIRETWGRDLDSLGIPWVVVVGDGDGELRDGVLELPVSDAYEALPAKTLALVDWVWRHTRFEHLLKIDDDCHLAVHAYFASAPYLAHHYHGRRLHRGIGGTDRVWHQGRSSTERSAQSADKSPEPSLYADGGAAYCLSRHAMAQVVLALGTTAGARLTRSSFLEDKLLGDLLALRGIGLSSEGHYALVRRRFGPDAMPVNAYENLFYPSRCSPTLVTHVDGHEDLPAIQAGLDGDRLLPPRIWPTHDPVRLGGSGTNQLELLSPEGRALALAEAPVLLIAVARNERVLAPHFLEHYRSLGVRAFVFIDNLSDDGTREFLASQPDVVLYSADTEYRHSHYGVSWQQAVLGAHALGKWVVLADLDEFLVYPGCEQRPIGEWLAEMEAGGHDAARVMMVDMYPEGAMDDADFTRQAPFEAAPCFDRRPLIHWALGSGSYSNGPTYLSALRHRLIPDSAPNLYTSQKIAVFRYQPWVRLAEGLHYASNLQPAPEPAWFAHFKYHAGFRRKVLTEVARKQHFNGAEEYRKYASMLAEAAGSLHRQGISATYSGSLTWARPNDED